MISEGTSISNLIGEHKLSLFGVWFVLILDQKLKKSVIVVDCIRFNVKKINLTGGRLSSQK